jgi:hypothetical protein
MNQKSVIISVVLFALIVVGMFTFAYLKRSEVAQTPTPQNEEPQGEVAYADITRITAKHFFIDGVHTFAGEIPMPTPCDLLEADALVMESFPEQIALDFKVLNNAEFCAEQVTNQRFKVSATASEEATIRATFMGRAVELNLVPPDAGETPDDFELFIKG